MLQENPFNYLLDHFFKSLLTRVLCTYILNISTVYLVHFIFYTILGFIYFLT